MSWMDSWSRPSKSQAVPPPFYLTSGDTARYCQTCGRIIGQRRANNSKASSSEVKYCSDKCKRHKPSTAVDSVDVKLETAILALLEGQDPAEYYANGSQPADSKSKSQRKAKKGDPRIIVTVGELELAVFGNRQNPEKVYGRRKNRAKRGVPEPEQWTSVDMDDHPAGNDTRETYVDSSQSSDDEPDEGGAGLSLGHVRPAQTHSEVNGSIGGEKGWAEKIEETPEMLQKRREGQKRVVERELVRNAARRTIAFGLLVDAPPDTSKQSKKGRAEDDRPEKVRRKCEALMSGSVVEPSFAKGDWSFRWRED